MVSIVLATIFAVWLVIFIIIAYREQEAHHRALMKLAEADILLLAISVTDEKEERNKLINDYLFNDIAWQKENQKQ